MTKPRIADAMATLEELLLCLDDAYWEASSLDSKDRFYNLISAVNRELSELGKLSVQDHNFAYEIITDEFNVAYRQLGSAEHPLPAAVHRTRTAMRLGDQIHALTALVG